MQPWRYGCIACMHAPPPLPAPIMQQLHLCLGGGVARKHHVWAPVGKAGGGCSFNALRCMHACMHRRVSELARPSHTAFLLSQDLAIWMVQSTAIDMLVSTPYGQPDRDALEQPLPPPMYPGEEGGGPATATATAFLRACVRVALLLHLRACCTGVRLALVRVHYNRALCCIRNGFDAPSPLPPPCWPWHAGLQWIAARCWPVQATYHPTRPCVSTRMHSKAWWWSMRVGST